MRCVTKFILLLIAAACIKDIECRLDGKQLGQLLQKIYSLSGQRHAVSRRNIANLSAVPRSGIFQEPSSRDLDVGFAVGVRDDGDDNDLLISNHPSKTSYSPTSNIGQLDPGSYVVEEPSSTSEELNIGVFVDPKNGVSYYTPRNNPNTLPERYVGSPLVHSKGQPYSSQHPILFSPYQQPPMTTHIGFGSYPTTNSIPNYLERLSNLNGLPYPYQISSTRTLGTGGYSGFTPVQSYLENTADWFSNLDQLQQTTYPYQGLYQQPFDVVGEPPYSPKGFNYISNQFPEPLYQPFKANGFVSSINPEKYPLSNFVWRYPRSYDRIPYRGTDVKFSSPLRNLQNVFRLEDHGPKGSYRQYAEPVVIRQEPQQSEVILDQQGTPVMSAQPYGDRQVGTFTLRNDHGYQVLVSQYDTFKCMETENIFSVTDKTLLNVI
jgi:hypothetical protein